MNRSPSPEATDSSQISGTVLIADDDTSLIEALKVRCRRLGLDVLAVADALTALSSADIAMPNLVILDIEMPGGNGLAACEMMACDQNMADIPVIILTGRKDQETIQRCQSLGAHYVHKSPNVWSQLEPLIRETLASSTAKTTEPRALTLS